VNRPVELSAIIAAHNPDAGRFMRTLEGLRAQTLPVAAWELLVIDNASEPPVAGRFELGWNPAARVVREENLGLTSARLRGFAEAAGRLIVLVDDDNVLPAGFLEGVLRIFETQPQLGVVGGRVTPEFEEPPPAWTREFWGLLALHDHGERSLVQKGGAGAGWPKFAPVGAGLGVRRAALSLYLGALQRDPSRRHLDRRGTALCSGGDNDLVFTILHGGWDVGYFPELQLTHLIPRGRLAPGYLARLNEGIMRTWVRVLALHGQCPWPAIPRWTVSLRSARAWWRSRAWRSPAHRIRWRGHVGQFLGQADLRLQPSHSRA